MDDIIFRLLDVNKQICGYCRWNIGALDPKNFYDIKPHWEYSNTCEEWHDQEITHRHKERFAGRVDKNGKLIFEGDVVEIGPVISYRGRGGYPGGWFVRKIVVFDDGAFTTCERVKRGAIMVTMYSNEILGRNMVIGAIIGNIHQDKHLLEAK